MKEKKTTFFNSRKRPLMAFLLFSLMTLVSQSSFAQSCSLACNANTQVSLNSNCDTEVTPAMILNGDTTSCPNGEFKVIIQDLAGNTIPTSPFVNASHIGKTWMVAIRDTSIANGNECWGNITVEDKIAPTITCTPPTGPVYCYNVDSFRPTAFDNCGAAIVEASAPIERVVNCTDPVLGSEVIKVVTQSFYAIDESGNVSNSCTLEVEVRRIPDLDTIDFPMARLLSDTTALQCDGSYAKLPNGNPSPVAIGNLPGTGVPMIDTFALFPSDGQFCNLITTYTDTELPAVGCVTKIMRRWDIFEWCGNPSRDTSMIQMIEIVDSEGPTFTCPSNFVGSTSGYDCEGYVMLPPLANLMDNCSPTSELTVDVLYDGGYLDNMNGGFAPIPVGTSEVTYIAYDNCRNSTTCTISVTIEDQTPPVTVCDQNTTVGLTNGGEAYVNAIVFDDGSYDDCALESFVVRRMPDNGNQVACQPCQIPTFTEFTYLGEYNSHHYYVSKWAKSARTAYRYAEALGGYVYSINNALEAAAVNDMVDNVPSVDSFYMGLNRAHGATNFAWDDGSNSTYRNWASSNPFANDDFAYVNASTNAWFSTEGIGDLPFIVEIEDVCGFSSYAKFCCEDKDSVRQVVFRAIDAQGNYNDCMVNAEIQDKVRPTLTCPPDTTVDCDFSFDPNRLSDFFGHPTIVGNCTPVMEIDEVTDLNQCNQGTITRTFTINDSRGNFITDCTQRITFENVDAFDIFNDVRPPGDITLDDVGCVDPEHEMFKPEFTGEPSFIGEDQCDLVGYNYTDQIFRFDGSNTTSGNNTNACFKIVRTFNIIDWCSQGSGPVVTAPYTQTIKVVDETDPEIITDCDPVFQCTYDSQCESGLITLTQTGRDTFCTAPLDWVAKVNPFQSSSPNDDIEYSGTNENVATITDEFPIGTHSVTWTFKDKCGNTVTCLQEFTIANCKAPTPYCLNGLAVDLMPVDRDGDGTVDTGMVALWANDFDAGSFHSCPQYDVVVSFSENPLDTGMVFGCDTIGDVNVRIYATAVDQFGNYVLDTAGNLLQAYCNTFVNVQDNMNACGTSTRVSVGGRVAADNGQAVSNTMVHLMSGGTEILQSQTDVDGGYAFPTMGAGGAYQVMPAKNGDDANGISTLDLVLIQRHILGMQDLTNAYKIIAADVNHDEKVSGVDVVTLRKLVLGVISELPENDSWRFIDSQYDFVDATDPLGEAFPESYAIDNLDRDMAIDFTAIKVGDVNNSASYDGEELVDNRSAAVSLLFGDATMTAGGAMEMPIIANEDILTTGLQFSLDYNQTIEIESVEAGVLNVSDYNIHIVDGKLAISYHTVDAVDISEGEVLMTIKFVSRNADASNAFKLSSDVRPEMYTANLNVMGLDLNYRSEVANITLYQNTPNPFMESTTISVASPADVDANLSIYDVTGKLIASYNKALVKGMNTIVVDKNDLSATGVLFYTLRTNDFTATRRMVVLR